MNETNREYGPLLGHYSRNKAMPDGLGVDEPESKLRAGLNRLHLDVDPITVKRLFEFIVLLNKWNRVYNLTSIRRLDSMVTAHLLDCLSVCAYVQGSRIADVGSGAGLPGIPLAICFSEKKFLLLDSSAKKTRFLHQAVSELALNNVDIEKTRIESYRARHQCDTVVCRAFGSLVQFVTTAGSLCRRSGRMLAMKGRYPVEELIDLPKGFELVAVHKLDVPGMDAQRHLVEIVRL